MWTKEDRRKACGNEHEEYDLAPDIHQMIQLLSRGEVYEKIPDLQPLWPKVVRAFCEIRYEQQARRRDITEFIWDRYTALYNEFLDIVRGMHEADTAERLAALKPIATKALKITARWLVFHCPTEDGGVVHVMV